MTRYRRVPIVLNAIALTTCSIGLLHAHLQSPSQDITQVGSSAPPASAQAVVQAQGTAPRPDYVHPYLYTDAPPQALTTPEASATADTGVLGPANVVRPSPSPTPQPQVCYATTYSYARGPGLPTIEDVLRSEPRAAPVIEAQLRGSAADELLAQAQRNRAAVQDLLNTDAAPTSTPQGLRVMSTDSSGVITAAATFTTTDTGGYLLSELSTPTSDEHSPGCSPL